MPTYTDEGIKDIVVWISKGEPLMKPMVLGRLISKFPDFQPYDPSDPKLEQIRSKIASEKKLVLEQLFDIVDYMQEGEF